MYDLHYIFSVVVLIVLQIPNYLFDLASNVKTTTYFAPLFHRQREDEVEPQHLEGILAPNHHVEGGIPQAARLLGETVLGETVTVHDTHLSENGLILLTAEGDHIPDMTGEDHTPPMKGDGPTLPVTGPTLLIAEGDHTLLTPGAVHAHHMIGVGHTHLTMVITTVQDLRIDTEDSGHVPMTVLSHHTVGAILQGTEGTEDGAILAVCHLRGATPAAVPQCQRDQGAVLRGKDMLEANHRAAGHLVRGVLEKATLTVAARTRGLCPGTDQPELELDVIGSNKTLIL